ncbi:hypothetical protein [Clostridium novyi]|nr:hypothetical protein [Clostridium novyi]
MPPKVPRFDINWYVRGSIFNASSIIGADEVGTEAVLDEIL